MHDLCPFYQDLILPLKSLTDHPGKERSPVTSVGECDPRAAWEVPSPLEWVLGPVPLNILLDNTNERKTKNWLIKLIEM